MFNKFFYFCSFYAFTQNESLDVVDRSLETRDDIITTSKLVKSTKDTHGPRKQPDDERKPKPKPTAAENDQCICEICTCG